MSDIFGRSWEEIQDMQQKRTGVKLVDMSKADRNPPTQRDRDMLEEYGSIEILEKAGLYGIADRMREV